MKKLKGLIVFPVLIALCSTITGNAQTILWNQAYPASGPSTEHSICQTADNGFLTVGSVRDSIGISKALFLKISASGALNGNKAVSQGNTIAYDCKTTLDHGFIIAGYVTDSTRNEKMGIAKYDSLGNEIYHIYPCFGRAYVVAEAFDSGYFFAGYTTSVNALDTDIAIAKIDKNGKIQSVKTFGGIGWDCCYALLPTNGGGCVISGGTASYSQNGGKDAFLAKIDASGSVIWKKMFGGAGDDIVYNLTATIDGGYALVGSTTSFGAGEKAFLIKVDSLGNYQGYKLFGGSMTDGAYGVVQTADGGFLIAANAPSYSPDSAAIVIKMDASGDSVWSIKFKGFIAAGGSPLLNAGAGNFILCYSGGTGSDTSASIAMFSTSLAPGTVTDIDGNVYHTITIGTQVWMVENLKTTKYNDGMQIPLVTDSAAWNNLIAPGYCWYNNDSANRAAYGGLYNWYTVNTGKLAPAGWHVATDSEWCVLSAFTGGDNSAGGPLKEAGTTHWISPNLGATDLSGFSALPGGFRYYDGAFAFTGYFGFWWSSTADGGSGAWSRYMYYTSANVTHVNYNLLCGFSVRCVQGDPTNPPASPSISTAIAGNGSVTISWNAVNGATSYNLYYQAGTSIDKASATIKIGVNSGYAVTGLTNGTQYTFAVSAENAGGESGLSLVRRATPQVTAGTVTDIDGNVYHTVTIGTKVWMLENLKTTRFNDGTTIPLVTDGTIWGSLTTPGYCWYNNDTANKTMYGGLYNWYTINTGNLAPTGWHVAKDEEWGTLPDTAGFSALLGGYRTGGNGTYLSNKAAPIYWSSTQFEPNEGYGFSAMFGKYMSSEPFPMTFGLSIRCVKN